MQSSPSCSCTPRQGSVSEHVALGAVWHRHGDKRGSPGTALPQPSTWHSLLPSDALLELLSCLGQGLQGALGSSQQFRSVLDGSWGCAAVSDPSAKAREEQGLLCLTSGTISRVLSTPESPGTSLSTRKMLKELSRGQGQTFPCLHFAPSHLLAESSPRTSRTVKKEALHMVSSDSHSSFIA